MPDLWSKAYSAEGYPAEVSGIYTLMFFVIHGFRMPVFFLLSGFFTALLWQRRGLRQLAIQRLKRIGLPLAIGAFTVIPITTFAFLWAFDVEEFSFFWVAGLSGSLPSVTSVSSGFSCGCAQGSSSQSSWGVKFQPSGYLVAGGPAVTRAAAVDARARLPAPIPPKD